MAKKLYRSESDRMVAGICGGIAELYDYDPTLIRLIVALLIFSGMGSPLLAYLLGWLIIPSESEI